ncbi:Uncharacterized protein SCF082_LOCUS211 [Durusdinium trenchii]|uniref:EF-hand domain-containing protein n=1 Tax=Durusdinium trenchii TaxID=1381693 RepID=A0ABP0H7F9_9DINO
MEPEEVDELDEESFGSDSSSDAESVQPIIPPSRRFEAGFQGADGIFIDFVCRMTKSRHPLLVMLLGDAKSRQQMARRASRSVAGGKMLRSYKDAKDLINFERLEWNLMDLLTSFWKKQKHPGWLTRPDALQQIVRRIRMHQRMELCVQSELGEYIVELEKQKTQVLQQAMVAKHEENDTSDEPSRRQGFWHTFHRGTRKGDWRPVTPAKTELYLPTLDGRGWVPPRASISQAVQKETKPLSSVKSAPELRKRLPFLTHALQASSEDRDQNRFTPPDSMRRCHPDRKMWWFQSGYEERRLSVEQREEVMSSKRSSALPSLPTLVKHRCPMSHFGECPVEPAEVEERTVRQRKNNSRGFRGHHHLPPIEDAVVPVYGDSEDLDDAISPTKQYIHACQREQVVPVPSSFVTGHSKKVDAGGKTLVDSDLLTLCAVGRSTGVEEVDFSGGKLLSDFVLGTFLEDVLLVPHTPLRIQRLSLKDCRNASSRAQASVVQLLQGDCGSKLRFLDLSGICLSMRHLDSFCGAVEKHQSLQTLKLCNTGLGGAIDVIRCLQRILGGRILPGRNLQLWVLPWDLCWYCSYAAEEELVHGVSLRSLDIAMNRLDFRGALVIEDALEQSRQLTTLNVAHNPLGIMGLRSLLRLLAREKSGLVSIDMENCFTGELMLSVEGIQVFTYTDPGGRYNLDLDRPYHRSLLRTLYKVGENLQLKPADTCYDISYAPGQFTLPSLPGPTGVWPVPTSGRLDLSFSIEKAIQRAVKGVAEENFGEVLAKYNEVMRFTPHFRKLIPLLAQWRLLEGHEQEQLAMLSALGRDFVFTATHLRQLCNCKSMVGTVVARLLPTLVGGKFSLNMAIRKVDNMSEFIKMLTLCKEYLLFNPESPTGHYKLDLSNTPSAYVAQALALLDRWESGLAKRKDLVDISENGDYSCVRNCMYAHEPLLGAQTGLQSFDQWVIPEKETLELDYVTNQRPDCHGAVLDDACFKKFLTILQQAECDGSTQIKVTRNLAHYINLTSMQMRQLLGVYQYSELREEALITTFFRIIDIHNEKIFRVRYEEQSELDRLRARLGYCTFAKTGTFFTYVQPEQVTYDFDFAKYDQRLAANIFFSLANDNIANFRYILPDGTIDKLELGVPRSWDQFARMPKEGIFHFTYKCSPQDRKFALRKSLLLQYGKWKVDVAESEVTWWAAANEAPEDVLEFLFWLRAKFQDTNKAFEAFDGVDGNGVLGLREFEEGMRLLKCRKFKGKDEKQRWTDIFRFLDPSGEGQVSKDEFLTLDTFWAEVEFSIREFMDWANRIFGKDLKRLWKALDEDGGGSIQRDEWESSLDKVGYFGPSGPIFSFIDDDDGGEISWTEFQMLKRFQRTDA